MQTFSKIMGLYGKTAGLRFWSLKFKKHIMNSLSVMSYLMMRVREEKNQSQ
jgi:hypothetical protein